MNVNPGARIDRTIVAGFVAAFPYSALVAMPGFPFQYLVGSNEEIVFPEHPRLALTAEEALMDRIRALRFADRRGLGDFPALAGDELKIEYRETPVSTDDHPIVDFLNLAPDQALIW